MTKIFKINFTKLDFPSDGLTIKALRRAHADEMDAELEPDLFLGSKGHGPDTLTDLIYTERLIAEMAFCKTLGIQPREPLPEGYTEELTKLYSRYGLASGPIHAEQLIRNIESQASSQAREHGGRVS